MKQLEKVEEHDKEKMKAADHKKLIKYIVWTELGEN